MSPSGNFLDKLNSPCLILPRWETLKGGGLSATPLPGTSQHSTLECGTYGACGRWGSRETQRLVVFLLKLCFVCLETVLIELLSWHRDAMNIFGSWFTGEQTPRILGLGKVLSTNHSLTYSVTRTNRCLWCLILCMNLARPWYPDICSNIIINVSVKMCFLDKINI